jgi:hypothetical protein
MSELYSEGNSYHFPPELLELIDASICPLDTGGLKKLGQLDPLDTRLRAVEPKCGSALRGFHGLRSASLATDALPDG